ncbi:PREDICTED: centrosomal protein of 192 kDa-like, partial [Merops nubicus]
DDIDDEEFFDNQLEAYFEQLLQPEMTRGDSEVQKLSECCRALKLSENALLQENFQIPETHQAVPGADSGNASDEDSQSQRMTGSAVQREELPRAAQQLNSTGPGEVQGSRAAAELRLGSLYLQGMDSHKADVSNVLSKQEMQSSECQAAASDPEVLHTARGFLGHYPTSEVVGADAPRTDAPECEVGLPDTYLSPTTDSCENISLATTDKGDLPHSVVYQNEEGKWVTDLAYYTSFDEEQDLNLSEDDKINEEFITGSEAAAMIAQDQEEFEKTHKLLQVGKDILNVSELAETSWRSANSCALLRSADVEKDASYLRLSLGEFFGQRSEALGCLGGGSDVKRPSFGYYITSPKKRQPVALLRQSDPSGGDAGQEISQLSEVFPDGAEAQTKEDANSTSCEGAWNGVDTAAGICKSINAEAATKSKAKGGIAKGKLEDKLPNHSDSVLSISTIASAIANASASAEPSQLAAMMMALSNKSKKPCLLPGVAKEVELSAHQMSASNVENCAFDLEKYLKKTDEIGHESDYESVVKHEASVQNLLPDTSFLGTGKSKDALAEDLINKQSKQQERVKRFLSYFNEESDIQNFSNLFGVPSHEDVTANSVKYSTKLSDLGNSKHLQSVHTDLRSDTLSSQASPAGNEAQMCGIPSAADREVAHNSLLAYQNSDLTSRCSISEETETVGQATNTVPEPHNDLVERSTGHTLSLANLKPAMQPSKYVSLSPTKAKPTQKLSNGEKKQNANTEKGNKDASAACGGSAKHVTFEQLSPTSQSSTDCKPDCALQPLEDEQCSFRPSTSPLIHSSPSETSGTAFSGSEADFTCTSNYQESSCRENVLPQSVYSSPSLSRLTYVSASDTTLKNSAGIHNPDTYWDEKGSELSTTIVRASPTPSQEQPRENPEQHSAQGNRREALPDSDLKPADELTGLQRKLDDVLGQEPSKEGSPKNEKQLGTVPSSAAASDRERGRVPSALPGEPSTFQPLAGAQGARCDPVSRAQRQGLPSWNVSPLYPGLSTHVPFSQNSSAEPHVPNPSFKSHVTTSESQTVSSSVPMLLTGHSLAMPPFAQQHLGNIPSTTNTVLSQLHGCSSTGFALPAGVPCSGIPAGHVENPLLVGIPLGPNIGPGSFWITKQSCSHSTSWNKDVLNMKSCTGQPLGSGRNEWELPKSPGIGHTKVPEELKFPNACCVGIASQTVLSIYNPTQRWLEVSIGILSVSVNGEK